MVLTTTKRTVQVTASVDSSTSKSKSKKRLETIRDVLFGKISFPGRKRKNKTKNKRKDSLRNSIRTSSRRRSKRNATKGSTLEALNGSIEALPCVHSDKDRFRLTIFLPTGHRLDSKCHLTSTAGDALRWTLDTLEVPARLAYLFGLFTESPSCEHYNLSDDFLLVDIDLSSKEDVLALQLRFKFCPTSLEVDTLTKEKLLRRFAYCQLRSDLLTGYLAFKVAEGLKSLACLIASAVHVDRLDTVNLELKASLDLEAFICGELLDWLVERNTKLELIDLVSRELGLMSTLTAKEAELNFILKCPKSRFVHSIFLDESDMSSYELLGVSDSGLTLFKRRFSTERFWELIPHLVLKWARLEQVSAIQSGRYFAVTLSPSPHVHEEPLKYKFYCKGNAMKCQSLLQLSQLHHKRSEDERKLSDRYRDWLLAGPIKSEVINGEEPVDKLIFVPGNKFEVGQMFNGSTSAKTTTQGGNLVPDTNFVGTTSTNRGTNNNVNLLNKGCLSRSSHSSSTSTTTTMGFSNAATTIPSTTSNKRTSSSPTPPCKPSRSKLMQRSKKAHAPQPPAPGASATSTTPTMASSHLPPPPAATRVTSTATTTITSSPSSPELVHEKDGARMRRESGARSLATDQQRTPNEAPKSLGAEQVARRSSRGAVASCSASDQSKVGGIVSQSTLPSNVAGQGDGNEDSRGPSQEQRQKHLADHHLDKISDNNQVTSIARNATESSVQVIHGKSSTSYSSNSLCDHSSCRCPAVIRVTLFKVNGRGLGLKLCRGGQSSGSGGGHEGQGILVQSLVPGGPASSSGRIEPGDEIVSVNGTLVAGLSYQEAVCLLRGSSDEITLELVKRPCQLSSASSSWPQESPTKSGLEKSTPNSAIDNDRRRSSSGGHSNDGSCEFGGSENSSSFDMSAFEVVLRKNARGLGFSISGGSDLGQPLTVKKVFIAEPAAMAGLREGDLLINANGVAMRGLSSSEAVNLLHGLPNEVSLIVARPFGRRLATKVAEKSDQEANQSPSLPPPDPRVCPEEFDDKQHSHLNTQFEVSLTKKDGSLGFTILKKEDGGLFVKEVLKEPAASAFPAISQGDRIMLVNGVDVSSMSHSGAISFLRSLPDKVTLKLEPNLITLDEDYIDEFHHRLRPSSSSKSKQLRHEAKMMLKDKSCDSLSRLKLRKDKSKARGLNNNEGEVGDEQLQRQLPCCDQNSSSGERLTIYQEVKAENSDKIESCVIQNEEQKDTSMSNGNCTSMSNGNSSAQADPRSQSFSLDNVVLSNKMSCVGDISIDSLPTVLRSSLEFGSKHISHATDGLGSARDDLREADDSVGGLTTSNFAKWRGTTLLDNFEANSAAACPDEQDSGFGGDCESSKYSCSVASSQTTSLEKQEAEALTRAKKEQMIRREKPRRKSSAGRTLEVTLDRGWYGRLGISLVDDTTNEEPNCCVVRALFPNSVADADGRIRPGFKLLAVNGESVVDRPTKEVIDLLRKIRGKFCLKFLLPLRQSDL